MGARSSIRQIEASFTGSTLLKVIVVTVLAICVGNLAGKTLRSQIGIADGATGAAGIRVAADIRGAGCSTQNVISNTGGA